MTTPLTELSIAEISRRYIDRTLSPVELTDALIEQIDRLEPKLHAFITPTFELARAQAKAAESEIMHHGPRSPLHGIPYGLKDIYDTQNILTTGHSALHRNRIPAADSTCAARLRQAGGLLLGKLATHEFATGGPAYDTPWPPACNPCAWIASLEGQAQVLARRSRPQ